MTLKEILDKEHTVNYFVTNLIKDILDNNDCIEDQWREIRELMEKRNKYMQGIREQILRENT